MFLVNRILRRQHGVSTLHVFPMRYWIALDKAVPCLYGCISHPSSHRHSVSLTTQLSLLKTHHSKLIIPILVPRTAINTFPAHSRSTRGSILRQLRQLRHPPLLFVSSSLPHPPLIRCRTDTSSPSLMVAVPYSTFCTSFPFIFITSSLKENFLTCSNSATVREG